MPRRPALGKGLDALIPPPDPSALEHSIVPLQSVGTQANWVLEIRISRIRPNPDQPRRNMPEEELQELAQSIREHGVLQPLLVRDIGMGYYELVSGERRLKAAERAGLESVPAISVDPRNPESSLTIALVENVQRADLSPLELALAYRRLQVEFGRTQDDIARTVGKSRPYISNTLRLLELPEMIQAAVADGRITAGHARALLMAPEHSRFIIYQRIIEDELNVRRAERAARTAAKKGAAPDESRIETPDPARSVLRDMELALESALGRKVMIERRKDGKGKITLEFYSDSDLTALVEKLRAKDRR